MSNIPDTPEAYREWWSANTSVPYGYCWCGCGELTKLAPGTDRRKGWVKGQPMKFLGRHRHEDSFVMSSAEYKQWWARHTDIPYGYCWCGCGHPTPLASKTQSAHKQVRGEPLRYIRWHGGVFRTDTERAHFLEEDRGYSTPCWVWQRHISNDGYGTVRKDGRMQKAHRVYYEDRYGFIPKDMELDHLCAPYGGPRHCVNPDHLEPVVGVDNTRRGLRCKLCAEDVVMIREALEAGVMETVLAERFHVSRTTIADIRKHRTWKQ